MHSTGEPARERRAHGLDRVAITGALLGLYGLFGCNYLTVRATRISAPEGLASFSALESGPLLLLALLMAASLAFSFVRRRRRRDMALAVLSRFIVLFCLFEAGVAAHGIAGPDNPFARVSPGPGAWMVIAGGYMIMSSCREASRSRRTYRMFCWGFWVGLAVLILSGQLNDLSIMKELANRHDRFAGELFRHLLLSFSAVSLGLILGFPLGLLAFRKKFAGAGILAAVNTLQTVPSLALFGLLIAPLAWLGRSFPALSAAGVAGIGWAPALVALSVYSLLPIVHNTIAGFHILDPSVREAGKGMGMNSWQLFTRAEMPLALPVIAAGVRVSGVQAVGNTAVAALIGAGGLGQFIFQGLGEAAPDLVLLGALPTVLLAVSVDAIMRRVSGWLQPRGMEALSL